MQRKVVAIGDSRGVSIPVFILNKMDLATGPDVSIEPTDRDAEGARDLHRGYGAQKAGCPGCRGVVPRSFRAKRDLKLRGHRTVSRSGSAAKGA